MTREAEYSAFIAGRSVAVVGPGRPVGDQSSAIDGHDVVVRFHYTGPGQVVAGAGTRTDVGYYNATFGKRSFRELSEPIPGLVWLCFNDSGHLVGPGRRRQSLRPELRRPNMVPRVVNDLMALPGPPSRIGVYCANFYLDTTPYAAPGVYLPGRLAQQLGRTMTTTVSAHDQIEQRRYLRALLGRRPDVPVDGDERFLELLYLADADFARQLAVAWPHRVPVGRGRLRQPPPRRDPDMPKTINTWKDPDSDRVRKTVAGTTRDLNYRLADWDLVTSEVEADPDAPAGAVPDGGDPPPAPRFTTSHVGGGQYAIIGPDGEVERVKGADDAAARAAELEESSDG